MLETILAGLLEWNIYQTKIEPKEERAQLTDYILPSDYPSVKHSFVLGDSVAQAEEKEIQRQQELATNASKRGSSYTGTGSQVELVEPDQYRNCVKFAKAKTGIIRPIGAGGRAGINSYEARVGEIGVEKGKTPHAVYIEKIEGEKITILESNYYRGWITRRVLVRSDFLGFIL